MPQLPTPKRKQSFRVTPPLTHSPEQTAATATRGTKQMGQALQGVSTAFLNEISQNRAAEQIASAERQIEMLYGETVRGLENISDPKNYVDVFNNFDLQAQGIIDKISHRGAKSNIRKWYGSNVANFQNSIYHTGLTAEWQRQRTEAIKTITHKTNNFIPDSTIEGPTVDALAAGMFDHISETEKLIDNYNKTVLGGRQVLSNEEAQTHINRMHETLPKSLATQQAFPLGRIEGTKWLEKNYKKFGLSLKMANEVRDELNKAWKDSEAVLKEEQEKQKQSTLKDIAKDIENNEFSLLAIEINEANISKNDQKLIKSAYEIGRERRAQAKIAGKDLQPNSFVYQNLVELNQEIRKGNITLEKAKAQVNLAYIQGDLGTGSVGRTNYKTLNALYMRDIESDKEQALNDLFTYAKQMIITTGTDETAYERFLTLGQEAGLDPEVIGTKHQEEWTRFRMFQNAINSSKLIQEASPTDIAKVGEQILQNYVEHSYGKEILDDSYEAWKKRYGVTPEAIELGDYDYRSAFKSGVVPRRWDTLPLEERREDFAQYQRGERELIHPGTFMWPDEYKTDKHKIPPKQTQAIDSDALIMSPELQLQVLRSQGGVAINKQIDFYINAGLPVEDIVEAIKYTSPTQINKKPWDLNEVREDKKTGKEIRWNGTKWEPIK